MDEIEIVDYQHAWPAAFEAEKAALLHALRDLPILNIEHVGSTAVPGLCAKPVIDISASAPSLAAARDAWPGRLAPLGYLFRRDNLLPDKLFFVKGLPPASARRTHHLHVSEPGGEIDRQTRFRDALRTDPALRARYTALKIGLAAIYASDREAYTDGKDAFIAEVMARAGRR